MSTFVMTVNMSGDAFAGAARTPELQRILIGVASKVGDFFEEGVIRDVFGNTCGVWGFEPDRPDEEDADRG